MTKTATFVYMDESSIDEEFKCSICDEPFEHATSTPCDHTFCRSCIEQWLNTESGNGSCPTCRESLSLTDDLKPANRIISNRIDRYIVKCLACGLEGIQRGSFSQHVEKFCANANGSCSAYDIGCPWVGPRSQLSDHLLTCSYEKIRVAIDNICAKNNRLEKQCNEQQKQITNLHEQCRSQQEQIDELLAAVKLLQSSKVNSTNSTRKILTFESLAQEKQRQDRYYRMPSSFEGLEWNNGAVMPKQCAIESFPTTGFGTALQKDRIYAVFNFGCEPLIISSTDNTFNILSFEATSAFQDDVKLTVTGRRNKNVVKSIVFKLRSSSLQIFDLHWYGIDELEFFPTGGNQLRTCTDTDRHIVLTALYFG